MASLRRSGFRTIGPRSQRRKTSWAGGPGTSVDGARQGITSSSSVLATTSSAVLQDGITLVRTRGDLNLWLSAATAAGDGYSGAFGVAVASSPAVIAGILSVPTPLTEEDWDGWLYHRYFSCFAGGTIAAATAAEQADQVNASSAALHIEMDSKAMRKLEIDMTLYAIIEVVELGTAVLQWAFNSRMLFKLP